MKDNEHEMEIRSQDYFQRILLLYRIVYMGKLIIILLIHQHNGTWSHEKGKISSTKEQEKCRGKMSYLVISCTSMNPHHPYVRFSKQKEFTIQNNKRLPQLLSFTFTNQPRYPRLDKFNLSSAWIYALK